MTRESLLPKILVFGCLAALLLVCFHKVLFNDHQFAYRDAAHFYYPLYERVQREWNEGRWPLWEPEENAGMPLMGNPTAAVLYPGKIVYGLLPYPWAARLYIVGHVGLAFAAMLVLMRAWGVSWTGSGLSALSYTFCGPILFQYCNVIYLVGAAWLPLGFLAVDRWIRSGSRLALMGLAAVLAMQTLGGDPQSAYIIGLCALAYAAGSAWTSGRGFRPPAEDEVAAPSGTPWRTILLVAILAAAWIVTTLELARILPSLRPPKLPDKPTPPLPWMLWAPVVVPIVWGLVLTVYFARKKPTPGRRTLWKLAMGLGVAGGLAGALTAAQLLPVVEFTQQTTRAAAGGPHEIYPFSVEPFRLAEMVWPNVFGSYFNGNASWVDLVKISADRSKVWVPSLYMGGIVVLLAASAAAFRRADAARVWLSWMVVATLVGSFGEYSSPIWASRLLETHLGVGYPGIGPFDPPDEPPLRKDGHLRDGDGGVYWAMTTFLPAFRQFRFPSKLMTFSILGIAALAGFGWDDLGRGRARAVRGARRASIAMLALSIAGLLGWLAARGPIMRVFEAAELASGFGPFNPAAAYGETRAAFVQGAVVFAAMLAILAARRRRPALAGAGVLLLLSADLAAANRRMIATAPQAWFEVEPEVLAHIKAAEAARPADGPFRIHRSPIWSPVGWPSTPSDDRVGEFMRWEHATIQPKYGINMGVDYTHTIGVAELYDYEWYFGGFLFSTSPEFARSIGINPGEKVVYFPRRSFNMWNTRYFILPSYTNDWRDENRGFAAFLADTEVIYPKQSPSETPESRDAAREWLMTKDYQIRRNLKQFPRAWVVRRSRGLPPLRGMSPEARTGPMMEIMYDDLDPIWRDPTMVSYDPRQIAWIENDDAVALAPFTRGGSARPSEKIEVSYPRSDRVQLDVTLDAPGLVVLADVYYPGWKLTIDDEPAPVYRVNRMMRAAAVQAGTHRLVYRYEPGSFRLGLMISIAGLGATLGLAAYAARRPRTVLPWNRPVDAAGG